MKSIKRPKYFTFYAGKQFGWIGHPLVVEALTKTDSSKKSPCERAQERRHEDSWTQAIEQSGSNAKAFEV